MVVAVLISYFAPSNRGFMRNKAADKLSIDSFHVHDNEHQNRFATANGSLSRRRRQSVTTLRRKPLRAMAVLTSVASDFDLISDWMFCYQTFQQDQKYRERLADKDDDYFDETGEEQELPYLIPPTLLTCVLVACVLGSLMYVVLATEGRVIAPAMQRLGVDKISMGLILFLTVLVEDIPQVVLTFLVEDYYEEGQFLSELAVVNLISSLYDTCIKLAESFDQRHDVVETGVWCKKSITGHAGTITDVLVLPEGHIMPPTSSNQRAVSEPALSRWSFAYRSVTATRPPIPTKNHSNNTFENSISWSDIANGPFKRTSTKPLLVEAFFPDTEPLAPRIQFLTASMDGTIKLWDISSYTENNGDPSSSTSPDRQCVKVFYDVGSQGFTCMAWVGVGAHSELVELDTNGGDCSNEDKKDTTTRSYFLTGCNNGSAKLYDLGGMCHATFRKEEAKQNRVASIAATTLDGHHIFACGYENGIIRIWSTFTSCCLSEFIAHDQRITSIRFLQDGDQFVSASNDSTLKLWDTRQQTGNRRHSITEGQDLSKKQDEACTIGIIAQSNSSSANRELLDCRDKAVKKFVGHRRGILSVAVVDDKTAILSGSRDGSARLWSIASGACLRIFRGHTDSVTSVQAIDRATFLTGSKDTTIKAWDALSGQCLRTYEGHGDTVTGLSVVSVSPEEIEHASSSFISSSADRSIKCWVLTSVSYRDPVATLEHILDFQENTCRCLSQADSISDNMSLPINLTGTPIVTTGPIVDGDEDSYYQEAPIG